MFAVAVAGVIAANACAPAPTSTPTSAPAGAPASAPTGAAAAAPAAGGSPVTLKFSTWGNEQHLKLLQSIADSYKSKSPKVSVEFQTIPFSDYLQKMTVQFAGGDAPDIGWVAERMAPQFIDSGALVDLAPSIKSDTAFKLEDVSKGAVDFWTRGEKIYGLPFSTPPMVIFYNKDLFQKAGLQTPEELEKAGLWSWDEYAKAAKMISEKASTGGDKVYGSLFIRNNDWKDWSGILGVLYPYGGKVLNDNGTYAMNSPEAVQSLNLYQDLLKSGAHPRAGEQIVFEGGKVGLFHDVMSYVSKARTITDFQWGMAPMPKGPAGRAPMLGMAGYSVFSKGKNQPAAVDFAKYIASTDAMGKTSQYFVPPRQSVLNSPAFLTDLAPGPQVLKTAVVDQMPQGKPAPSHLKWQEIDTVIRTRLDAFYAASATSQQTVEAIGKDLEPILKK
jgi:multiple sugar transport system substrate-binding protein